MARAKRHYIPGQIWHITHRWHKRDFLLKFAKDRKRWLQWLYEAKKRYGLALMGVLAIGRKSTGIGDSYQLREHAAVYNTYFEAEKDDIATENTFLWDV